MGIEQVSLYIANNLGAKLNKTKEEVAVIKYGLFVMLHTSLIIAVTLIVGLVTNSVKEIMIISLCSAMLKRYSGGVHASSPTRCLVIGVSMSTMLTFICNFIVIRLSSKELLPILIIGLMISYFVIYKRCPIGSSKKPLKNLEKRKLLRKKSFNVMNIYSVMIIFLYSMYVNFHSNYIKSVCVSILFGALIQIFALSKMGENIIKGTDRLLDLRTYNQ